MNKGSIRIKDIAERANVSVGTVDRVLHNRGRVAEDVRQKVLQIATELQYEPNLIARTLGSNRSYKIAALVPNHVLDPYWDEPRYGFEKAARELKRYGIGVEPYEFDLYNVDSFVEQAARVTEAKPDGILVAPLFYRESLPFFEQWKQLDIPFVMFNTQITEHQPLSYIGQDSYQSGFLAGKLLHYGQSEPASFLIAHIAEDFANSAHLIKKEQGFRDYFAQQDLAGMHTLIRQDFENRTQTSMVDQLDQILDTHPRIQGIFVTTSKAYVIAPCLQSPARKRIRLVGYDLLEKNLPYLNDGAIDFLINQNAKGQGYWGIVRLADHLVFQKPVAPIKYLSLDIVTKENLQYYIDSE